MDAKRHVADRPRSPHIAETECHSHWLFQAMCLSALFAQKVGPTERRPGCAAGQRGVAPSCAG